MFEIEGVMKRCAGGLPLAAAKLPCRTTFVHRGAGIVKELETIAQVNCAPRTPTELRRSFNDDAEGAVGLAHAEAPFQALRRDIAQIKTLLGRGSVERVLKASRKNRHEGRANEANRQ